MSEEAEQARLIVHEQTLQTFLRLAVEACEIDCERSRRYAVDRLREWIDDNRSHVEDALGEVEDHEIFTGDRVVHDGPVFAFTEDVSYAIIDKLKNQLDAVRLRIAPSWPDLDPFCRRVAEVFLALPRGTRRQQKDVLQAACGYVKGARQKLFMGMVGNLLGRDGLRGPFYLKKLPRDLPGDVDLHGSWTQ